MKFLAYISLFASFIALIGYVMNPYPAAVTGLHSLETEINYSALLFQISSWVAVIGSIVVIFLSRDKVLKIIGFVALGIPLLVILLRYGPFTLGGSV